jgi:1-acyl-sn-glycerol-3-phosphate acyltransferase
MKDCDEHIDNDRTLIIFPEGTRVNYGKNIEIKKGVLRILDALKLPSIIINHNAGKFWSKDSFLIKPGTVVIETVSLPYNVDQLVLKNKIQEHFL